MKPLTIIGLLAGVAGLGLGGWAIWARRKDAAAKAENQERFRPPPPPPPPRIQAQGTPAPGSPPAVVKQTQDGLADAGKTLAGLAKGAADLAKGAGDAWKSVEPLVNFFSSLTAGA